MTRGSSAGIVQPHERISGPLRVALVDDDEGVHSAIRQVFKTHAPSWTLESFTEPAHALRALPYKHPHAVLMDISMPGIDGIECTRKLKARAPKLPIIIFTARNEPQRIAAGFGAGADGYIIKPSHPDDLSSDVHAFPRLIEPLLRGTYDVATGSRLLNPQTTERSAKRELLSRGYNRLLKVLLRTRFSDAQCGFKAITRRAAQQILPLIANSNWFFDTELLVLAERRGFRVFDLPIVWIEAPDSKVHLCRTIIEDLSGILRLKFNAENRALGALP